MAPQPCQVLLHHGDPGVRSNTDSRFYHQVSATSSGAIPDASASNTDLLPPCVFLHNPL
jgi:hypothetical protein